MTQFEKSEHTPSPWYNIDGLIALGDAPCENTGQPPERIALIMSDATCEKERQANADIVAASPDLLEVAQLAHEFLNSLPEGWLAHTSADIGKLNDFYLASRKVQHIVDLEKGKRP